MRVLDLGGTVTSWLEAPRRPRELVIMNIGWVAEWARRDAEHLGWAIVIIDDACDPHLRDTSFDLVYSNSVIEHVGGHERRSAFAQTVHRYGTWHWVQTPYRYFPIEPHYRLPFVQHLPVAARARLAAAWRYSAANRSDPVRDVLEIELLSKTEMRFYFPESRILPETSFGLVKGLLAVKP
jgi:hypothetical protein